MKDLPLRLQMPQPRPPFDQDLAAVLSLFQIDFAAREFAWAVCGGLVLTLILRRAGSRTGRNWTRFCGRPVLPIIALSGAMFLVQTSVAARFGWPVPAVHDEFSYLLSADTFASGRATNPTHPAWEFLETYHVLWQPTYQSKYPPGNGLVLALGQVLTGYPIVGMWICLAAVTGGLFWMLSGWFTRRWAAIGTLILLSNWPLTKLWGQTFFGGGPALLGGVLVYGAFARLLRRPNWPAAVCLGLGLVIWSITRPYEGLLASLPVLVVLFWNAARATRAEKSRWLMQVGLPLACVMVAGLLALGWYHQRVTGSPWTWPYRLYEATYTKRTSLLNTLLSWTTLGPRERTIPSLEYASSAGTMRVAETKPVLYGFWKAVRQWWFHVGLIWTIPFCLACGSTFITRSDASSRGRRLIAVSMTTITLVGVAILLQRSAGMPHYAAPIMPLVMLLTVEGLRRLRVQKVGGLQIGQILVSWMIWTAILFFALPLVMGTAQLNVRPWSLERERILRELESRPRRSLVIVHYGPQHSMHEEWVYNRADIASTHVIWARHLDPSRMRELIQLFPDRDVWIVEPDVPQDKRIDLRPGGPDVGRQKRELPGKDP